MSSNLIMLNSKGTGVIPNIGSIPDLNSRFNVYKCFGSTNLTSDRYACMYIYNDGISSATLLSINVTSLDSIYLGDCSLLTPLNTTAELLTSNIMPPTDVVFDDFTFISFTDGIVMLPKSSYFVWLKLPVSNSHRKTARSASLEITWI